MRLHRLSSSRGLLWRPLPSSAVARREKRRRLDGGGVTAEAAVTTKERSPQRSGHHKGAVTTKERRFFLRHTLCPLCLCGCYFADHLTTGSRSRLGISSNRGSPRSGS